MHRPRDVAQIVDPLIEEQIGPDMSASRLESHDLSSGDDRRRNRRFPVVIRSAGLNSCSMSALAC